jgi:hypothetical protein
MELVQNSREAAVNPEDMRISVVIESIQCNSQNWVRIIIAIETKEETNVSHSDR